MKFLIIDGNSIANRAYYGIRPLSNKKGVFTHALVGFFNIYLKLIKQFEPDCIAAAFDLRAPTFRTEKYKEYKANRKGMPDDLAVQMPYIKEVLHAMGILVLEREGFEADDILGTISKIAEKSGNTCVLATGDRDSFQLISEKVSVNLAKTNDDTVFTPELIYENYGVKPHQMIDVKALMGDASDNIPGVAGIGEKTALSLIQKYGSIENIYNDLTELEVSPAVKKKLEAGRESCFLSKELGTIRIDVPVFENPEDYVPKDMDKEKLSAILTELEAFALLKKLDIKPSSNILSTTAESGIKTQISTPPNITFIIQGESGIIVCADNKQFEPTDENLKDILNNDAPKCTFNIKDLWSFAFKNNIEIKNVIFDLVLSSYLLNVNQTEFNLEKMFEENGIEFNGDLQNSVRQLFETLYKRVFDENLMKVLTEIEIPLAEVLTSMELIGVKLDVSGIREFGQELEQEISVLEERIYKISGYKFNIQSPKQLGEILFGKLMLPYGKKTKTGYSTNSEVLDFLMDKHEIIPLVSEYRVLTKLNSTYVTGLLKVVSDDGRIHSTFKQTETRTGRISSAEPNIQNIPVRTKRGKVMRKFFISENGYKFVDADYSQIELRILAHISNDEVMKNAFLSNEDIHTITASQVLGIPAHMITPEMRSSAKAVNFGIVYGIGAFSLSKDINVSVAEADRYIKNYLGRYSGVRDYIESTVKSAKKNGYVCTMFDRRRYVPEINASNKNTEAFGKRIAMNTPIQGTAADLIKIAMICVYKKLKNSGLDARLILQVHDELIVEASGGDAEKAAEILKDVMENAAKLSVPLVTDIKSGNSWYDTH